MKRKITASVIASFATILLIASCSKIDTTDLGSDLIPAVDNVNTFERIFDVISDNKLFNDSTRMLYSENHALGIIENDIEFGKTTADIYSCFTPLSYRTYPFTKRDSVTIDSVVLSMAYVSTFGDSNAIQDIEVREIDRFTPFPDSLYFLSVPDFNVEPDPIGSASVDFRTLNDSVFYRNGKDTVRSNNQMRIQLDTAWARRFVNYDTVAGDAYNNDTIFKTKFRGLQIKAATSSPGKNALAYYNLGDNDRTRITFYCRVVRNGKTDTIAPYFAYTSDAHANAIRRTPANNYLANVNNATDNDEKLYIQASPGSYVTVKVPGLDTLSNNVINRAELILEKYPSDEDFYGAPSRLFIDVLGVTSDSSFTVAKDFVLSQSDPGYELGALGGVYSKNKYIFNLTRYVQEVVKKGTPNRTLRVYAPFSTQPYYTQADNSTGTRLFLVVSTPVAYGRVVLYGGAAIDPAKKMRLRIIYSKI